MPKKPLHKSSGVEKHTSTKKQLASMSDDGAGKAGRAMPKKHLHKSSGVEKHTSTKKQLASVSDDGVGKAGRAMPKKPLHKSSGVEKHTSSNKQLASVSDDPEVLHEETLADKIVRKANLAAAQVSAKPKLPHKDSAAA